jgi:iron complex transport system permease protein
VTTRALLALVAICAAAFLLSLLLPLASLAELMAQDRSLGTAILVELRLPRALLALTYGAMLGASGAAVQALFANPLASPT